MCSWRVQSCVVARIVLTEYWVFRFFGLLLYGFSMVSIIPEIDNILCVLRFLEHNHYL